ncbi:MAG: methylthioribose-phosphate isomerase [Proteobacteria bacterium]|nr:methylthioribose-phosphate isomerase [Pseudomonadota bacterium]
MNIDGIPTHTLRARPELGAIDIIDQTRLPHELHWVRVSTLDEAAHAIRGMQVRGAPLIGATAAYGLAIALGSCSDDAHLEHAIDTLWATRPTAVNLHWALTRMSEHLTPLAPAARLQAAWAEAKAIADEDIAQNLAIGQHGLGILRQTVRRHGTRLNIMTHCNAGWLATVDWGTALSPVYTAYDAGLPVHVWVSETRPRNQGLLTAWELAQHGVPHTVIADNAAGILMREGKVDAVIVGADRIAANGDVANKVGTYLKALACADNGIPFYVAAPRTTIDFDLTEGSLIEIEERHGDEFRLVHGLDARGVPSALHQLPAHEAVANPAFDVTPAHLITAIITERGVCEASKEALLAFYPEVADD